MAAIIWTDVVAVAPELEELDEAATTMILDHVNTVLNTRAFGGEESPRLKLARVYLAAHMASGLGVAGGGGEVTSESMGGLSRSYVDGSSALGGDISETGYGRQYLMIVNQSIGRGPIVI